MNWHCLFGHAWIALTPSENDVERASKLHATIVKNGGDLVCVRDRCRKVDLRLQRALEEYERQQVIIDWAQEMILHKK